MSTSILGKRDARSCERGEPTCLCRFFAGAHVFLVDVGGGTWRGLVLSVEDDHVAENYRGSSAIVWGASGRQEVRGALEIELPRTIEHCGE
jgi:hypothetical protein